MFKISRKRLAREEVRALLFSLDAAFAERLAKTINVEDYCRKLSDNAFFEIAESNGDVVGAVAFYENPSTIYYITYVCVSVSHRQKGAASLLIDSICRYADCRQKSVSLEVRISNERAMKIYEKAGFAVKSTNNEKIFMTRKFIDHE